MEQKTDPQIRFRTGDDLTTFEAVNTFRTLCRCHERWHVKPSDTGYRNTAWFCWDMVPGNEYIVKEADGTQTPLEDYPPLMMLVEMHIRDKEHLNLGQDAARQNAAQTLYQMAREILSPKLVGKTRARVFSVVSPPIDGQWWSREIFRCQYRNPVNRARVEEVRIYEPLHGCPL